MTSTWCARRRFVHTMAEIHQWEPRMATARIIAFGRYSCQIVQRVEMSFPCRSHRFLCRRILIQICKMQYHLNASLVSVSHQISMTIHPANAWQLAGELSSLFAYGNQNLPRVVESPGGRLSSRLMNEGGSGRSYTDVGQWGPQYSPVQFGHHHPHHENNAESTKAPTGARNYHILEQQSQQSQGHQQQNSQHQQLQFRHNMNGDSGPASSSTRSYHVLEQPQQTLHQQPQPQPQPQEQHTQHQQQNQNTAASPHENLTFGVGIEFASGRRELIVSSLVPLCSAHSNGTIRVGDEMIEAQGVSGLDFKQARDLILGRQGTTVNLTFRRQSQTYRVVLMRGNSDYIQVRLTSKRARTLAHMHGKHEKNVLKTYDHMRCFFICASKCVFSCAFKVSCRDHQQHEDADSESAGASISMKMLTNASR